MTGEISGIIKKNKASCVLSWLGEGLPAGGSSEKKPTALAGKQNSSLRKSKPPDLSLLLLRLQVVRDVLQSSESWGVGGIDATVE